MNDRLPPPPPDVQRQAAPPTAQSLGTPMDFRGRGIQSGGNGSAQPAAPDASESAAAQPAGPKKAATETIAQRAGALSDEIDFPDFVASLVHGTFDAIVDASIRQMESYADLVSAVAKSVEQFTEDNVTLNQARDWLVQQYPQDLALDLSGSPKVLPRSAQGEDADQPRSPDWLSQFQLQGEELTPELIEEQLVPRARTHVGQSRQQMLATMVLLGLNRVVVRDGSISARLRFRASAADTAKVDYAVSDDPQGGSSWGNRGSAGYSLPSTKVSTVGVNVQSDSDLKAELFGEVKINFASETLPLDRFVDEAKRTLLERRARSTQAPQAATRPAAVQEPAAQAPAANPAATPAATPAAPAQPDTTPKA
jgi:hypothetical protein